MLQSENFEIWWLWRYRRKSPPPAVAIIIGHDRRQPQTEHATSLNAYSEEALFFKCSTVTSALLHPTTSSSARFSFLIFILQFRTPYFSFILSVFYYSYSPQKESLVRKKKKKKVLHKRSPYVFNICI